MTTADQHLPPENSEQTTTQPSPAQTLKAEKSSNKKRTLLFVIIISLIIGVGFYYLWAQNKIINEKIISQAQILQTLTTSLSENNAALHTQEQLSQHLQNNLQQLVNQTNNNNKTRTDWILAEVTYLINLASFNINIEKNVPVASKLLEAADSQLKTLTDPKILSVRRALAADLTALKSIQPVDTVGIILKLESLQTIASKLPFANNDLPQTKGDTINTGINAETKQKLTWKQNLAATLQHLKGLVIVRKHEQPIEPLAAAENQLYIIYKLQLKLLMAEWAVLHQQPAIYVTNLQQAMNLIERYFSNQSGAAQGFLIQLNELQKINLQPSLPNLSASVQAIEQAAKANTSTSNLTVPSSAAPTTQAQPPTVNNLPVSQQPTVAPTSQQPDAQSIPTTTDTTQEI